MRDTSSSTIIIITIIRFTRFVNRYIFILINRYIINNWLRNSDWNFFLYSVRNNSSSDTFRLRILSTFIDWLKSSFLSRSLIKFNLNFFSINCWLSDILFVVNISWYVNSLSSTSLLVNSFFSQWSIINNLIFFL